MKDEFHLKNKMIQRVDTHLRKPENESLWLDQPPRLTELVVSWETKATAKKLRQYYKGQADTAKAAEWKISLSKWQRMREDALLGKAKLLRTEITPLTTGTPAPGAHYGITADDLTTFSPLVDAYDAKLAEPGLAKGGRKTLTDSLRSAYHAADEDLDDIDDFIEALRVKSEAHRVFVETYFNIRAIGGGGSDGGAGMNKGEPDEPTQPAGPA